MEKQLKMFKEIYSLEGKEKQDAIDSIPLKKGAIVMIYEDPYTRERPEGQAILIKQLTPARFKGDAEYWAVHFNRGDLMHRFICPAT